MRRKPRRSRRNVPHRTVVVEPRTLSFSPCGRRWREAPDEGSLSTREVWRDTPHPSELVSPGIAALPPKGRGHITAYLAVLLRIVSSVRPPPRSGAGLRHIRAAPCRW